jgi:hypothetical protein
MAAASRSSGGAPAPKAAQAASQKINSTQQAAKVIAGKTFFQNGEQWIDSEIQLRKPVKTVRLQFASDEYFKLLREKPEAAAWLALSATVQFTLGDTLYEVAE